MSAAVAGARAGGAERAWKWFFRALLAATLLMVNALLAVGVMQVPRAFDAMDRVSESAIVSIEESTDAITELSGDLSADAAEVRRAVVQAGDDVSRAVDLLEEAQADIQQAADAIEASVGE